MRREKTSVTNATYAQPSHVRTYVMSETHRWFGRKATNERLTRSGGLGAAGSGVVVRRLAPRTRPVIPAWRISRSTVHRASVTPSRFSCFQTFRAP